VNEGITDDFKQTQGLNKGRETKLSKKILDGYTFYYLHLKISPILYFLLWC